MYYTGLDPRTMQPVYVAVNPHEKAMQRALIQYRNPKNYDLVVEALKAAGRTDLIGFDKKCLVRPRNIGYGKQGASGKNALAKGTGKAAGGQKNAPQGRGQNGRAVQEHGGNHSAGVKKKTIRNVHRKKTGK